MISLEFDDGLNLHDATTVRDFPRVFRYSSLIIQRLIEEHSTEPSPEDLPYNIQRMPLEGEPYYFLRPVLSDDEAQLWKNKKLGGGMLICIADTALTVDEPSNPQSDHTLWMLMQRETRASALEGGLRALVMDVIAESTDEGTVEQHGYGIAIPILKRLKGNSRTYIPTGIVDDSLAKKFNKYIGNTSPGYKREIELPGFLRADNNLYVPSDWVQEGDED